MTLQVSMRVQLNSILFSKTLVRKDAASSSGPSEIKPKDRKDSDTASESSEKKDDGDDFSSKAQIMTLMTTDVDKVSALSWHILTLVGASRVLAVPLSVLSVIKTPQLRSLLARFSCTVYWARLPLSGSLWPACSSL